MIFIELGNGSLNVSKFTLVTIVRIKKSNNLYRKLDTEEISKITDSIEKTFNTNYSEHISTSRRGKEGKRREDEKEKGKGRRRRRGKEKNETHTVPKKLDNQIYL